MGWFKKIGKAIEKAFGGRRGNRGPPAPAQMPNIWTREQEAAARAREERLAETVRAREHDLNQVQAQLARQQQEFESFSQKMAQLEATTAAEKAAKEAEIARFQAELQAKKQEAANSLRMMQESKKDLENTRQDFDALKANGFVFRPDGWERMTAEQREQHKNTLRDQAHRKLGIDTTNHYNFAITGATGTGKSSLINALRGMSDNDPQACKTGEVEITTEIKRYPLPDYPHVVLWDIPGAGTDNHPAHTYFLDKCLYAFDCLIIVTAGRFTELEARLGQTCRAFGMPVVFVRNKSDQSLHAKMKREGLGAEAAAFQLRREVEANIRPALTKYGLADAMLFVISAWAFLDESYHKMDEEEFVEYTMNCAVERRRGA